MLFCDVCLYDVCLTSVAYIGPKSERTERSRKTKIGTEAIANVTCDSNIGTSRTDVDRWKL